MAIQHQVARLSDAELDRALDEAAKGNRNGAETYQLWVDCLRREKRVREGERRPSAASTA